MENLKYRMYGLVPYNLSPIQQGIQFGHGVVEYMIENGNSDECKKWSLYDKTFIILNGGTTNKVETFEGTLNKHLGTLIDNGIKCSDFYEPDLGFQLTSVNFLVDERVWDKEKYPDRFSGITPNIFLDVHYIPETEEAYIKRLGGEKNVFLREFLKQFRLA